MFAGYQTIIKHNILPLQPLQLCIASHSDELVRFMIYRNFFIHPMETSPSCALSFLYLIAFFSSFLIWYGFTECKVTKIFCCDCAD